MLFFGKFVEVIGMKRKKIALALLVFALISFLFLSLLVSAHEPDHNCVGDECRICFALRCVEELFTSTHGAVMCAAVFLGLLFFRLKQMRSEMPCRSLYTPVNLKVMLLD